MCKKVSYNFRIFRTFFVFLNLFFAISVALVSSASSSASETKRQSLSSQKAPVLENISFKRVFPNVSFKKTIFMLQTPSLGERWYVIEQTGKLSWFDASDNATEELHLVIDLPKAGIQLSTCNECGLLGMAFDPDFANNGFLYLSYTVPEKNRQTRERMRSVIARFTLSNQGQVIDINSKQEIFSLLQPFGNHNGGHIVFGEDGFLYTSLGDGGSGNDPFDHGQDKTTLLGSMLRITKEGAPAPGNILASQGGAKEIYAWGLRNPWRWSFDRKTQQLWVADVGQSAQEEVNIVVNGGNYGWRCEEGLLETSNDCSTSGPYIAPVTAYGRDEGTSITGGYVYRGKQYEELQGVYFFGDFNSGRIWALQKDQESYKRILIEKTDLNISSFAEGPDGEIYALNYFGGIYKLSK